MFLLVWRSSYQLFQRKYNAFARLEVKLSSFSKVIQCFCSSGGQAIKLFSRFVQAWNILLNKCLCFCFLVLFSPREKTICLFRLSYSVLTPIAYYPPWAAHKRHKTTKQHKEIGNNFGSQTFQEMQGFCLSWGQTIKFS